MKTKEEIREKITGNIKKPGSLTSDQIHRKITREIKKYASENGLMYNYQRGVVGNKFLL